jgi:hypothetical protein
MSREHPIHASVGVHVNGDGAHVSARLYPANERTRMFIAVNASDASFRAMVWAGGNVVGETALTGDTSASLYLSPEQAAQLGAALCALAAEAVVPEPAGSES